MLTFELKEKDPWILGHCNGMCAALLRVDVHGWDGRPVVGCGRDELCVGW